MASLRAERDSLLGENERLAFQLECATAQRHEVTTPLAKERDQVEISQQLIDRRVDALERKYGGEVARHSATTIQRAFRAYRLQKRFQSIALEVLKKSPHITRSDDTNHELVAESVVACAQQQHECERKRRYRVGLNLLNKRFVNQSQLFLIPSQTRARHHFPGAQRLPRESLLC